MYYTVILQTRSLFTRHQSGYTIKAYHHRLENGLCEQTKDC